MSIANWELERLRKLAENAKGRADPWLCRPMTHKKSQLRMTVPRNDSEAWYVAGEAIADFITYAHPQTILDLIAEIERLRAIAGETD